jgi:hypothetical protein
VLFRQRLQDRCVRRPRTRLRLRTAGELHFIKQDFAELLGRADVELAAREPVRLLFVLQHALREIAGQAREHLRIDLDPVALHACQHRRQRPLQRFVHSDQTLAR